MTDRSFLNLKQKSLFFRRAGFALVSTLAAVVLITILILAFFGKAQLNRKIAFSSNNQIKAEILGSSSIDIITGQLRQEIVDNSIASVQDGVTIYTPTSSEKIVPERVGVDNPTATPNLIAVSSVGKGLYTGGKVFGSAVSISDLSRNGRYLSQSKWFNDGPDLASQTSLPTWVYITQGSGPTGVPSTLAKPNESDYTIGRFAFSVYDTSGLLNANIAGYPPSMDTASVHYPAFKTSTAYADLSVPALGTDVAQLIAWRNSEISASNDAYRAYLQTYGSKYGFLQTCVGNQAFLTRRELMRAAQRGYMGISQSSLPFLTTYSRSVNVPSWCPKTPQSSSINYEANAEAAASENRNLPNVRSASNATIVHYRDDGTFFTYSVQTGEQAIRSRFSLAKLAWLTSTGPSAGISPEAIQACFGLRWEPSSERWNYVGPAGSTMLTSIATIADVAAAGREPNFFEQLKAGILSGSLGQVEENTTLTNPLYRGTQAAPGLERNRDFQLLRIGANIIDCSDPDNYPTIIAMLFGGVPIELAGVEDLPYFHSMWMRMFQEWTSSSPSKLAKADLIWVPILINPHASSITSSGPAGPAAITMGFADGVLTRINDNDNQTGQSMTKSLAALGTINISSTLFEGFRTGPQPVRGGSSSSTLGLLLPYVTGDYTDVQGFRLFSYQSEYTGAWPALPSTGVHSGPNQRCLAYVQNVVPRLQYLTPGGRMKTYATLSGNEAIALTSGIQRGSMGALYAPGFVPSTNTTSVTATTTGSRAVLWDPRSSRLGPSQSWVGALADSPPIGVPNTKDRLLRDAPFAWSGDFNADRIFTGLWPQGGKAVHDAGKYTNLKDPDGVIRPADGWLGDAANPYRTSGSTLDPAHPGRPVILQRPYQSVAELGYVFRDSPWKTLSFFDETSADVALLDLFSVSDEPVLSADRVNVNTRQLTVQEALLTKAGQSKDGSNPLANPAAIAQALADFAFTDGNLNLNPGGVVNFLSSSRLTSAYSPSAQAVKYSREAVSRAIGGTAQTRTWNVLIDVVVQSGRFVKSASPTDFLVEGEKRYWVSVSIDRYTAKIVDQQKESVNE